MERENRGLGERHSFGPGKKLRICQAYRRQGKGFVPRRSFLSAGDLYDGVAVDLDKAIEPFSKISAPYGKLFYYRKP